jgi:periplasmic copper chaperone A
MPQGRGLASAAGGRSIAAMTRKSFAPIGALAVLIVAVAALTFFALIAQAQTSGDIAAQSAWARATPPGAKTGAVYLTLMNKGGADDRLIGVTTPVASMAGLHVDIMDNGVMKMRPIEALDLKAGGDAVLKPGGMHIMLMGLKRPLKQGGHFPLTLQFAHAPPLTVRVEIAKIGAMSGGDDMGDMGDMKGMH